VYILFEGIDTCGKSTQIGLLSKYIPDILITYEPGGTDFGVKAREILLGNILHSKRAEILLFLSDRAEHYESIVKPNIDKIIISDRGFVSGMAYAMANTELDFDTLLSLNLFALEDTMPNYIILFVTNRETLVQRLGNKGLDGIEARGVDYLLQVQSNMQFVVHKLGIPFLEIDATQDIESIATKIKDYLGSKI
jgi:dTMP kinase